MNDELTKIWHCAIPLLQRCRPGDLLHTVVAKRHLEQIMLGEQIHSDTLVPTILLHDIGWSACPPDLVRQFFSSVKDADQKKDLRTQHMEAGANMAHDILYDLGWNEDSIDLVTSIIRKHDLADEMKTNAEQIVFDADFSWRFSSEGFYLDLERFAGDEAFTLEEAIGRLEREIIKLKTKTGREIAARELRKRKTEILLPCP
ncbi:MAG: hypothetical protein JXA89_18740 [Anaerolineae bacterium]|nr:hypothetical protein [Anaerolineae bacterium]